MDSSTLGFDPALASHAAASLPAYAAAFTAAKRLGFVNRRAEMAVALIITAGLNAGVALGAGTAAVFPALSTAAVGAVGAMVMHAVAFRSPPEK